MIGCRSAASSLRLPTMTSPLRKTAALAATAALFALPFTVATTAEAAVKPKHYKSCAALQKDYPHGVAKKGKKDKVKGSTKPVTTFKVSTKVYKMNDGPRNKKTGEYDLDRDNDGVACEKR